MYGSHPFTKQRDTHFLGATVFFSCEWQKVPLGKPGPKSVKSCSARFSTQKRNLPLSKSLPVHECNTSFISRICYYQLMVCSCGRRKANKYTNIQTCIHTHTLFRRKTISRNHFKLLVLCTLAKVLGL